jgi:tetratricopeptide (TPR) repeat protein
VQVSFLSGALARAEEHFARLSSFLDADGFRQVPGAAVVAIAVASLCACSRGHADLARERIAQAMVFARDSNNLYELGAAQMFESFVSCLLREPQGAKGAATQTLALSEDYSFPLIRDLTRPMLGWSQAQLGCANEGVAVIRQGLAGLAEAGAKIAITAYLAWLAEAQALDGKLGEAIITIEEALAANPEELFYRPNALTCRGELRLKLGQTELAEADFHDAIALAQTMSAKAWELRATMSLARLLESHGRRHEARAMLADIYDWFTESFDGADLKVVKALLDQLGA